MAATKKAPAKPAVKPKQRFRPLGDRVVVKMDPTEEYTPGGLTIVKSAQEQPRTGTVIAIGPGRPLPNGGYGEMNVQEGDRVLLSGYTTEKVPEEGPDVVVVRETDVIGVYEDSGH